MKKWFDHRINARLLKQSEAELHTEQQLAILETLNWFADNEQFVRFCFKHRSRIIEEIVVEEEPEDGQTAS